MLSDDEKIANMMRRSKELAAPRGSALPPDPSLPQDAQVLRETFKTPLEIAVEMANDENLPAALRLSAAGKALPFTAKQPATKTEVTLDDSTRIQNLYEALMEMVTSGTMSREQIKDLNNYAASLPDEVRH